MTKYNKVILWNKYQNMLDFYYKLWKKPKHPKKLHFYFEPSSSLSLERICELYLTDINQIMQPQHYNIEFLLKKENKIKSLEWPIYICATTIFQTYSPLKEDFEYQKTTNVGRWLHNQDDIKHYTQIIYQGIHEHYPQCQVECITLKWIYVKQFKKIKKTKAQQLEELINRRNYH